MLKFKLLILSLFLSGFGFTQTIINAERLINKADSSIYAIALSYNGTQGNSVTTQVSLSPAIILMRKKNDYKLFGGYSLLSTSGKGILNSGFIHIRHNLKLSERMKTFEFYQLQFNDVLLLKERTVFGAGLRYALIQQDSLSLDFELGLMREIESLNEASLRPGENALEKSYRITSVNSFKWDISKQFKVNNVIYYQPKIDDFKDYRLLNEMNLIVSVVEHVQLMTIFTLRYDSKPPGELKNLDTELSIGLNIKF